MTSTFSKADLHCHSTASQLSKLGVQCALGLPECATPPEDVLELAERRGMDFVTITDHDTIDGVLSIQDDPRVFVSEELTAQFRGEPQAVHVLCWGITPDDHARLQERADDVERVAEYLHDHQIACALAHPFFAVAAPLAPRHRRRLARLFPVWETRNGSRAAELNQPAQVYIETHGGTGVAGSDDHAGVDIGRTWTQTPYAATPDQFLDHLRGGRASAHGEQGSAAKWAHAALGLATRALGTGAAPEELDRLDPQTVFTIVERVVREGDVRGGAIGADLTPDDARRVLRAWLAAVDLDVDEAGLLALLQDPTFRHSALYRRARRAHERQLARAVDGALTAIGNGEGNPAALMSAGHQLFGACVAAIPYAPAAAFLGREKAKLAIGGGGNDRGDEPRRIALVADGVGSVHGVTRTLAEIRERGVPGFDVEVVGTDHNVDRRLPSVADAPVPFYDGLSVGVPSLPDVVETLAEGRYDAVHVCSPGPAGVAATLVAKVMGLPVVGSYHTELAAYTALRTGRPELAGMAHLAVAAFYGACDVVLSPSEATDAVLSGMGIGPDRVDRWDRGVDVSRFGPERRDAEAFRGPINVLYAGRLTTEKGADLLADAFVRARTIDPRLHLVLAGGGPEEETLRRRLGPNATFLGWLAGDDLARAYASADLFCFPSRTDTFGQVILEAQASGLPVIAVAEGGPRQLVESGVTGLLRPADADAIADALVGLAANPARGRTLADAALVAVRERTWERSLERLAGGYARALGDRIADVDAARAA
jgi:glycosyltransferase involved in cell wall biosynthesis/predicted metal-dependent phosphoesterase TrpH